MKILSNCRETSFLISKQQEEKITSLEKAQVNLHLLYCKYCKAFAKQVKLVKNTLVLANTKNETGDHYFKLSEEKKKLYKQIISDHYTN